MAGEIESTAGVDSRLPGSTEGSSSEKPRALEPDALTGRAVCRDVSWLSFAVLLSLGVAAALFAGCALWQARAIVAFALEVSLRRSAASVAPARPAPGGPQASPSPRSMPAPSAATAVSLVTIDRSHAEPSATNGPSFETRAEASETAIALGRGQGVLDDDGVVPGDRPSPSYPVVRCTGVFVYIVTLSDDAPEWSAASLGLGKSGPARIRYPGDTLGDFTVLSINDDSTGLNPEVWLERDGVVCRAELAGNPARVHVPLKAPRQTVAAKRRKRRRR
jgi:hypothetical protein